MQLKQLEQTNQLNQHKQDTQYSTPFNIEDYVTYITGEDYRKAQINKLIENNQKARALQYEKKNILYALSTEESVKEREEVHQAVGVVYKNVLTTDTQTQSIQDIVVASLEQEKVDLLRANRNTQHFDSKRLFEENLDNPNQKSLVKSKHLTKRLMKKQKTPMQTLTYAYSAKSNMDRDLRLAQMEEKMADLDYKLSLLVVNQNTVVDCINQHTQEIANIKDRLSGVEGIVKDDRKLKLYALYTSKKQVNNSELALEIGVTRRTVVRWLKELRKLGVLPTI